MQKSKRKHFQIVTIKYNWILIEFPAKLSSGRPEKVLSVPPISELDIYVMINCISITRERFCESQHLFTVTTRLAMPS